MAVSSVWGKSGGASLLADWVCYFGDSSLSKSSSIVQQINEVGAQAKIMGADICKEKAIEIDVLLELQDYLRANCWFLFRKFKFFLVILLMVGVVYPILYFTGSIGEPTKNPGESNWVFLIPWGILLLVLVSVYFNSKKALASHKALQETIHYTFSEEGIQSDAPSSSGYNKWETLREAFETKHNFLLFLADRLMYVIPKRCFQNDGQVREFKNLLSNHLASKAKLKK